jgi:hypothetical protein
MRLIEIDALPFLKKDRKIEEADGVAIDSHDLITLLYAAKDHKFRIKTMDRIGGNSTDEIIFESGAKLYLYDMENKTLKMTDNNLIRRILEQRMAASNTCRNHLEAALLGKQDGYRIANGKAVFGNLAVQRGYLHPGSHGGG